MEGKKHFPKMAATTGNSDETLLKRDHHIQEKPLLRDMSESGHI